jgi:hypothetical protein
MRNKVIIIVVAISLMSIKCAEKPLNVIFDNKSDKNILFSSIKNSDSLKTIISAKFFLDARYKYVQKNSELVDTCLISSDLYYYLSKNKAFYTFYFFRVIKFDTLKNNYVFEKRYDSINIDKEKILIGDEGKNIFTFNNKLIIFKAKSNN